MKTYSLKSDGVLKRYDYLWRLSPDRWAWEYLRRNPDFLQDAENWTADDLSEGVACSTTRIIKPRTAQTLAHRWGLALLPDPHASALDADVIWQKTVYPDQFEVHVSPRAAGEMCDICEKVAPLYSVTLFTDRQGREFLLLRGQGHVIQVRCTGLSLLSLEPVRMKLQVSDVEAYERQLRAYKDALALYGPVPEAQAPLWTKRTQMLRDGLVALDCKALGLSRKEIARVLYGPEAVEENWGAVGSTMKDSLRYLVNKAKGLRDGGYLMELLGARLGPEKAAA
ncbi:MAG: DUF2285 domain-containing protein [Henriciella sp.]|uniref:DNA -binding domain-containing protein n=1 Tax=Henriciella sp. TaxID=1968823 RepID=UPI003C72EBA6